MRTCYRRGRGRPVGNRDASSGQRRNNAAIGSLMLVGLFAAVSSISGSVANVPPAVGATTRFLLARHGQTTFNAEKRFQGSMDKEPVLTDKGMAQARDLGKWLREVHAADPVDAVFVSPLTRARQTLEEIETVVDGLPAPIVLQELREIDLYEWEGQTQQEIKAADPARFRQWKEEAWELQLANGRFVVQDLWTRAAEAWQLMRANLLPTARPEPVPSALIVAHGTLGKALISTALGLPATAFRHFSLKNGEVVEISWPKEETSVSAAGAAAVATGLAASVWWRRRHPEEGPWRCLKDEEADLRQDAAVEAA